MDKVPLANQRAHVSKQTGACFLSAFSDISLAASAAFPFPFRVHSSTLQGQSRTNPTRMRPAQLSNRLRAGVALRRLPPRGSSYVACRSVVYTGRRWKGDKESGAGVGGKGDVSKEASASSVDVIGKDGRQLQKEDSVPLPLQRRIIAKDHSLSGYVDMARLGSSPDSMIATKLIVFNI